MMTKRSLIILTPGFKCFKTLYSSLSCSKISWIVCPRHFWSILMFEQYSEPTHGASPNWLTTCLAQIIRLSYKTCQGQTHQLILFQQQRRIKKFYRTDTCGQFNKHFTHVTYGTSKNKFHCGLHTRSSAVFSKYPSLFCSTTTLSITI